MADQKITSMTAHTAPVDADLINIVDTVGGNLSKKITWTTLKAFLKTYFDGIYGGAPTGTITIHSVATPPTGYLLCDGATVSRTTYASLYALIGFTYGADPGGGNFILPNLKGKVVVGYNSSDTEFNTLAKTGGAKTHTLSVAEMPAHNHNGAHKQSALRRSSSSTAAENDSVAGLCDNTQYAETNGSGSAHNNLQPYITLYYIIKT